MNIDAQKKYFRDQLIAFQQEMEISEYQLSRSIGRCESYIQTITSGRNMPSMQTFLEICAFLNKSPRDFFLPEEADDKSL